MDKQSSTSTLFQALCEARGIGVLEVSAACQVTPTTAARWARGARIAARFAASLVPLLGRDDTRALFRAQGAPPTGSGRFARDRKGTYGRALRLARREGNEALAGLLATAMEGSTNRV